MTDSSPEVPDDPPDELEEFEEAEMDDVDEGPRDLIEDLREESDASLRLAVRYTADDYEVLFAREDIADQFPGPELEKRVETLVMKGLGDPPQENTLFDFGSLESTLRFYENALIAHFPYREWSGFVFTLDRTEAPLVDLVSRHLDD